MLRTRNPVHALTAADRDDALEVCARNLPANVFVAARLLEGVLTTQPGTVLGHRVDGRLQSLCWSSANLVPVEADDDDIAFFADRVRRWRRHCASILGPAEQVAELWRHLAPAWGPARAVRAEQPLMSAMDLPSSLGLELDPRVRPATTDEVDLVMPAAAHMFEGEIGYPPYSGSGAAYRTALLALIDRGHTFVVVEDGAVVFKADVGSVRPRLRPAAGGVARAAPARAGSGPSAHGLSRRAGDGDPGQVGHVVRQRLQHQCASHLRGVGFEDVGAFSTVLL